MSGSQQTVAWVIDAQHWPRALLRAELIERGLDAVGYETVTDALDTLAWRTPGAIIVDVTGQPRLQVARLLDLGVPVVITGGVPDINAYTEGRWAAILRRPVSIGELADAVMRATREPSPPPSPA